VTERKQFERALQEKNLELENASLAKDRFLASMSHELRTPLNAILGFAQILEMEHLGGQQADNVQQILRAGKHLLHLINEVLDITRIETGNLAMSPEVVRVSEVVGETLDLVQSLAARHGVHLHLAPGHRNGAIGGR
jgi:signal transduction histidine kinase